MRAFLQGRYGKCSLTAGSSLYNDVSLLKRGEVEGNGQYFKAHVLICPPHQAAIAHCSRQPSHPLFLFFFNRP